MFADVPGMVKSPIEAITTAIVADRAHEQILELPHRVRKSGAIDQPLPVVLEMGAALLALEPGRIGHGDLEVPIDRIERRRFSQAERTDVAMRLPVPVHAWHGPVKPVLQPREAAVAMDPVVI